MKKTYIFCYFLLTLTAFVSCTTPYAYETNSFEDALVVEATITNELKKQEVKLTRTFTFEETSPAIETGADVFITDDAGNQYGFDEIDGKYISSAAFQAVPNRTYQLHITTSSGKSYSSTPEVLTKVNEMQNITPEVTTKEGILGVAIVANSFDPTNSSKYYRYEYEETYKIIAPKWVNIKATAKYLPADAPFPGEIELQPRTYEAKTCYTTKNSDAIILTNTSNLLEDRVEFPVRFISVTDYVIRERYSILVKQYVQNLASHTYYKTLRDISGSESILSQNQPGFFSGNIQSDNDANEKVLGFFNVSSYSEKRIFFNFYDIFPTQKLPDYQYNCPPVLNQDQVAEYFYKYCFVPLIGCEGKSVLSLIYNNNSTYFSGYDQYGVVPPTDNLLLELYPIECGDCTSFSNNIKPSFWID